MTNIEPLIAEVLEAVTALRHDLHAHPELAFGEERTSAQVRAALTRLPGLTLRDRVAGTGIVATLNADRDGPCMALRADMDALPIDERTGAAHASKHPGRMHACGHDGHTSGLVGAAMVLTRIADELPGRVKFIFQPAEEEGGGGGVMCEQGVLENPKVDAIVALHGSPTLPVGSIAIRSGAVMAANDGVNITVRGVGSHGAYPHRGVDPILVASHIVVALQSIVSRFTDPQDSAVVTIGKIEAGAARNVIPQECHMLGTMRYYSAQTGERVTSLVRRIAARTAEAFGAAAEVAFVAGYPVTNNDETVCDMIRDVGRDVLGEKNVVTNENPSMWVEDFAFYGQRVPAAMFRLGVRPTDRATYPGLHHPEYDFTDGALPVGIRMLCEVTRAFLARAELR